MRYVLQVVLSNAQHPEYGQATIPFPIPNQNYDSTIELLGPLEIGDTLRQDCQVDELDSFYRDAVIQGLYLYAIDMISSLGSDGARESVTECERLMREIAGFWGYESPALDDLYAQIRASLKDQEAWENTVEIGGIQ